MSKLKIIADCRIPFLKGILEPYADITYLEGKEITKEVVKDADALIIRTRTICDSHLLSGSKVKIIATATIGTDHIDTLWCKAHGIKVCSAQGCNANAVASYVFAAIYQLAGRSEATNINGWTIGIIGVGHVGKKVEHMARSLGFNVLLCDPPRAEAEGPEGFVELPYLLEHSDVVTIHVPLTEDTRFMANEKFFKYMRTGAYFINTSRGEVVDNDALYEAGMRIGPLVIDTWKNEPDINRVMLKIVDIATPHIAGYSYQGKQNGTAAAVQAIAAKFGIEALKDFYPFTTDPDHQPIHLDPKGKSKYEIADVFHDSYAIMLDDLALRTNPDNFEKLRSEYNLRNEVIID